METHRTDLPLWDFRLEDISESGSFYLIFRFHCWALCRGFVNTTHLPVALLSPLSEQDEHVVQSCRHPVWSSLGSLSLNCQRREKETQVCLTDINLQMLKEKKFLRLYSLSSEYAPSHVYLSLPLFESTGWLHTNTTLQRDQVLRTC